MERRAPPGFGMGAPPPPQQMPAPPLEPWQLAGLPPYPVQHAATQQPQPAGAPGSFRPAGFDGAAPPQRPPLPHPQQQQQALEPWQQVDLGGGLFGAPQQQAQQAQAQGGGLWGGVPVTQQTAPQAQQQANLGAPPGLAHPLLPGAAAHADDASQGLRNLLGLGYVGGGGGGAAALSQGLPHPPGPGVPPGGHHSHAQPLALNSVFAGLQLGGGPPPSSVPPSSLPFALRPQHRGPPPSSVPPSSLPSFLRTPHQEQSQYGGRLAPPLPPPPLPPPLSAPRGLHGGLAGASGALTPHQHPQRTGAMMQGPPPGLAHPPLSQPPPMPMQPPPPLTSPAPPAPQQQQGQEQHAPPQSPSPVVNEEREKQRRRQELRKRAEENFGDAIEPSHVVRLEDPKPLALRPAAAADAARRRQELRVHFDLDRADKELLALVSSLRPSEADVAERQRLFERLSALFAVRYPENVLHLFGSAANGFATQTFDLDLCLEQRGPDIRPRAELCEEVGAMLEAEGMREVKAIAHARIPVVKFIEPETGIDCDVCFDNMLAVANTKLLRDYSFLDARLAQLVIVVKHWAKQRNCCSAYEGTLSSYAYVLACIYVMQTRRVRALPVLQQMQPTFRRTIDKWRCDYHDDVQALRKRHAQAGPHNTESISELLFAFFAYWQERHDWNSAVVSPRVGTMLTKSAKGWTRRVGTERHLICIEDPFNTQHDLGRVVDRNTLPFLKRELRRAYNILQSERDPLPVLFERNRHHPEREHREYKGKARSDSQDRQAPPPLLGEAQPTGEGDWPTL